MNALQRFERWMHELVEGRMISEISLDRILPEREALAA